MVVWVVGDSTNNGTESGTSFKQAPYFKEIGFNLHDTMIWRRSTVPQGGKRYEPEFEYMFILSKVSPKTFNPIKIRKLYKDNREFKKGQRNKDGSFTKLTVGKMEDKPMGNVWVISTGGGIATKDKIAYEHPAIFPEELATKHIYSWSNEGDLIYDIGSEISEEYCKIAQERLDKTTPPLF